MSREPAEDSSPPEQPLSDAARAGRLQRAPGADGYRVDSFIDVVKRHGLTMACLAGLCLLTPGALPLLAQTTARALGQRLVQRRRALVALARARPVIRVPGVSNLASELFPSHVIVPRAGEDAEREDGVGALPPKVVVREEEVRRLESGVVFEMKRS